MDSVPSHPDTGRILAEVPVASYRVEQFEPLLDGARFEQFATRATQARDTLDGRVVWNVNSTATGGGVAEMLQVLLAYVRGTGIDTRWLVIGGTPDFFAVTKRLHNWIHGDRSGGTLDDAVRCVYESVLAENAEELLSFMRPGDIALLHDPQTAGLAPRLRDAGILVVWRCHIGLDHDNETSAEAWAFLRPYLEAPHAFVFSRAPYVPPWIPDDRVHVIPPSIDPLSPKNQDLEPDTVEAIVAQAGLVAGNTPAAPPAFVHRDGSIGTIRRRAQVVEDGPPPPDAPLILQVSRWDRLKDMAGVLSGFVEHLAPKGDFSDAHLTLAGPSTLGVTDDPEGAEVLDECTSLWKSLPADLRRRVHLASLPMEEVGENAAIVNALQRHATVVVQKSLAEGFGLTVSEAMWKARPVIGSAVGGIVDQIVDGESGLLIDDPRDLAAFGDALSSVLGDPGQASALGAAARERVSALFLGDRHLLQYEDLFTGLLDEA